MALSTSQLILGLVCLSGSVIMVIRLLRFLMSRADRVSVRDSPKGRTKYRAADDRRFATPIMLFSLSVALTTVLFVLTTAWRISPPEQDYTEFYTDLIEVEIPPTVQKKQLPPEIPVTRNPVHIEPVENLAEIPTPEYMPTKVPIEENSPVTTVVDAGLPTAPSVPEMIVEEDDTIICFVARMPRFPGCEDLVASNEEKYACAEARLLEYISKSLRYPRIALENGIEGRVVARFVVEKDGTVSNIQILRDIGGGCGEEAFRVISEMNAMPERWSPGRQQGRPVRVQFTLPVSFKRL